MHTGDAGVVVSKAYEVVGAESDAVISAGLGDAEPAPALGAVVVAEIVVVATVAAETAHGAFVASVARRFHQFHTKMAYCFHVAGPVAEMS
jgi:hypothetical protein